MKIKMRGRIAAILVCITLTLPLAAVKVSFSGDLDADLMADFKGGYLAAHEFGLGMNLDFGSGVSAGFCAASTFGRVPAAGENPTNRWTSLDFDGLTVTLSDKLGTGSSVELIDLVYQYGSMDAYYYYKIL